MLTASGTMKYCRIVQHVSARHSPAADVLKNQYIQYKKLKKLLKRGDSDSFYTALLIDVRRVNWYE